MTPQLQQAIRLLQLSTLELQQELQQALESNPLLEQTDLHEEVETQETVDNETLDSVDALEKPDMPEELPLDASWDEIYTAGTPSGTGADYQDDELPVYQGETTQSLQDYLMWQVELTPFTETDRAIATSIVDAVDDTGYLTVHIRIQDGAARFVDSPCPDHICESFGWLSEEDQTATCLPARAVLSIIPTT